MELENRILMNEVPHDDLVFRRYKVLLVPIDGLFGKTSGAPLAEILSYFMRNSTLPQHININLEEPLPQFPFKCIGMVQSVATPPFGKCSLSAVCPSDPAAYRVMALLFDT